MEKENDLPLSEKRRSVRAVRGVFFFRFRSIDGESRGTVSLIIPLSGRFYHKNRQFGWQHGVFSSHDTG